MGRVLAIDYGKKRCGLAVTDPLQIIASALETVDTPKLFDYIKKYLSENEVEIIVMGLPKQMSGEFSESYKYIAPFFTRLKKEFPQKEILYVDERFTSVLAQRAILDGGVKKSKRQEKGLVDRVSATIILQSYLENKIIGVR